MDITSILPDLHPATGPHFSTNTHQKTLCIIGAGPAGLAALKTVLDSQQYKSGKWIPVAFEAREDVGGVWFPAPPDSADPPLTPLYDCLTTNIPHPIMGYSSLLFPPETPLFPTAETVYQYLKDFTSHFSLRPRIKFSTTVTSVSFTPEQTRRWLVQTSTNESYYFDLIMVCNGHYRVPLYPSLPGLSDWRDARKASHSVYYRHPLPTYKDKTLLIVGGGPSGRDLSLDLNGYASKIIFCGSGYTTSIDPNGLHLRPRLVSLGSPSTCTATFADGTIDKGIDYCILATGYSLSFPFFQPPLIRNEYPPPVPPLPKDLFNTSYSVFPLSQQLWPLQSLYPPESIAFLGLLYRVAPFPLIEVQARAVLRSFDTFEKAIESGCSIRGIDKQAGAVDIVTRWETLKERLGEGNVIKDWHRFESPEQFDYRDRLSIFAETEPLVTQSQDSPTTAQEDSDDLPKRVVRAQDWEREMYERRDILRKTWAKIEKSGDAEKWLKDVGKGGVNDWVDLMERVVKYGEELTKGQIEEEEKARL